MSNKLVEEIGDGLDPLLNELAEGVNTAAESMEQSENHAMLVLGVKYVDEDGEEGVQTYINACGYFGIIEEGLYAELMDQVQKGHWGLFTALRRVVRDMEDELGISPEQELEDEPTPNHLH